MAALGNGEHPSSFTQPATLAVSRMAAAMSAATGYECRVVVKTIYAPPGDRDDVAVKTFARSDTDSSNVPGAAAPIDWVKENTDFDEVFYRNAEYFLSNDLSREGGYKNSHITPQLIAIRGWPYLSTIVWPVYGPNLQSGIEILGFLCVDTKHADAFVEELDVVVGKTLAPLWYVALQRLEEATEQLEIITQGAEESPSRDGARSARPPVT
jgi:hypothetical protein